MAKSRWRRALDRLRGGVGEPTSQDDALEAVSAATELHWAHQVLVVNARSENPLIDKASDADLRRAAVIVLSYLEVAERNEQLWDSIGNGRSAPCAWVAEVFDEHPELRRQAERACPGAVERIDHSMRDRYFVPPAQWDPKSGGAAAFELRFGKNLYWSVGILLQLSTDEVPDPSILPPRARANAAETFVSLMVLAEHDPEARRLLEAHPAWAVEADAVVRSQPDVAERVERDAPVTRQLIDRVAVTESRAEQLSGPPPQPPTIEPLPINPTSHDQQMQVVFAATAMHQFLTVLGPPSGEIAGLEPENLTSETTHAYRAAFLSLLSETRSNSYFQERLKNPNDFLARAVVSIVALNEGMSHELETLCPGLLDDVIHADSLRDSVPERPFQDGGRPSAEADWGL